VNFKFEKSGYFGILHFYGEITSKRDSELTEALMVSLNSSDYLIVNLQNCAVSDCTSLRPIWSAHLIARMQNKSLMLIGVDNRALRCDVNNIKNYDNKTGVKKDLITFSTSTDIVRTEKEEISR
jgi:anti-anti-sigma regulatory factor